MAGFYGLVHFVFFNFLAKSLKVDQMHHYKVRISYKGTNYFGWQSQEHISVETDRPTVQTEIHKVLRKISKYQDCNVSGASRTDRGVHAQSQLGKLSTPFDIEADKLQMGMNALLPRDIRILECETCEKEFNPSRLSKNKEYHYYFCTSDVENPVLSDFVAHVPGALNIKSMKEAAKLFEGEHDFFNFCSPSTQAATTVRTVLSCEVLQADFSSFSQNTYCLKITGAGFLKHMVRCISGALFGVGKGSVSLEDILKHLAEPQNEQLGRKAKAKGLHLIRN